MTIHQQYQQTLTYLYEQLPMFQRQGAAAMKKDLTNIRKLCQALGQPQDQFPSIHIAGTNGKGSSAHMLAAVLQTKGLKTGLYTSPHYKDFRERIKINGQLIPKQSVVAFVDQYQGLFQAIQPSFFEITVALAFTHFAKEKVDIAIIETGLGGRLDSTNIIQPILSLITNISYDHQQFLGDTLELIAGEKAGIIKSNTPVVIGETHPETQAVFQQKK
ncbi:MAG: Mur ligase family protein [Bacteroidota bacterium]